MKKILITLLLNVGFVFNFYAQTTTHGVSQKEYDALVALYNSTNGDDWKNKENWKSDKDVSEWYGITVEDGKVTGIKLKKNNLSGTIPTEIGDLVNLKKLNLYTNTISGGIPEELYDLITLERLEIGHNKISGAISSKIGQLTNLVVLDLDENDHAGTIPDELYQLTKLQKIFLRKVGLIGSISSKIGNLTGLTKLFLDRNSLEGEIPKEIGKLKKLKKLYLYDNNLTTLPKEIGGLEALTHLELSDNKFTELPIELGDLPALQKLYLGGLKFKGHSLPSCIVKLTGLATLKIHNCGLSYLPKLPEMKKLFWLDMTRNKFDFADYVNMDLKPGMPLNKDLERYILGSQAEINLGIKKEGNKVTLTSKDTIAEGNIYTWFRKKGEETKQIAQTDNQTLVIEDVTHADSLGVYYCEITNDKFKDLKHNVIVTLKTGVYVNDNNVVFTHGVYQQDYEALKDLYHDTDGDNWIENTNWMTDKDVSEWFGVQVESGRVVAINLNSNNLNGNMPQSLKNLEMLRDLKLGSNKLKGGLTSEQPIFEHLEWFKLWGNKDIDTLPIFANSDLLWFQVVGCSLDFGDFQRTQINIAKFNSGANWYRYEKQANVNIKSVTNENKIVLTSLDSKADGNVYKWYHDGKEITGANEQTYVIADKTALGVAGSYYCKITNPNYKKNGLFLQTNTFELGKGLFKIDKTYINFGEVFIGTKSNVKTFTITNAGTEPFTITNAQIEVGGGNQSEGFSEFKENIISQLNNKTLQAHEEFSIDVFFQPNEVGRHSVRVNMSVNVSGEIENYSIIVEGKGMPIKVEGLTLTPQELTINVGDQAKQLIANIQPSNATDKTIVWKSSNSDIANIDNNGLLTPLSAGEVIISATTKDGNHTATCKVTVTQPVTGISVSPETLSLELNATSQLIATIAPTNATNKNITWTSSDDTKVSVDETGLVTALAVCEDIEITAESEDGKHKATCKVTVTQPVTGISVSPETLSLELNATSQLIATIAPTNATNKNITWTSSDDTKVSVDATGLVTALAVCEDVVITAQSEEGHYTSTCKVSVVRTGINDINSKEFTVYPNPTSDGYIKVRGFNNGTLKVLDITGRVIEKILINNEEEQVLYIEESGVYMFLFEKNKEVIATQRVIVK